MTLQASTWAYAISLYTVGTDPDDTCGYVNNGYHHNNRCGRLAPLNICTDNLRLIEVHWGESDLYGGDVRLSVFIPSTVDGSGNYVDPVFYETFLDSLTWYLSPVVFIVDGVTYTLSVCPDPHEPFPEWPLSQVFFQTTINSHPTRSFGNLTCGAPCDPDFTQEGNIQMRLLWSYNIYSDKITISMLYIEPAGIWEGDLEVDYDSGNWSTGTYTLTLTERLIEGKPDITATVSPADSCDIPPPPPPCEAYTCFPECLVNTCDGGATPNPLALFLDVTSLNGCCLNGSYGFTWTGGGYYSGKIGDQFLVTCGYVEIWYECVGDQFRRRVKVTDVTGGTSESTENDPGACSGTPENFIDSFICVFPFVPVCFNLPPFFTDTVTFDIYTNN